MTTATTRRPVVPADLFRIASLQEAQLAPDGRSAVYALATTEDAKEERSALWALSLVDGTARQLTAGTARDSAPAWSPDGSRIAFMSTRGGKPQIYVIAVDGGEATAVTSLEQGVGAGPGSGPIWSPDGGTLAFTAPPAAPPDLGKPYRLSRHVYRFDGMGYLDGAVQGVYTVDASGGEARRLTDDDQHYQLMGWSPAGGELLALASMRADAPNAYRGRLVAVGTSGERREITGEWGDVLTAAWLPDGRRAALLGTPRDRPMGSKSDLWVVDAGGGEPVCRTAGLKFHPGANLQSDMAAAMPNRLLITADGASAYVAVQAGGILPVYRIGLEGAERCEVVADGERACLPFDLRGGSLLMGVSTLDTPMDLHLLDVASGEERRLTEVNGALLAELAPAPVEALTITGADGTPVEGWLMRPPTGEAPYPTVLYIHGGPHYAFGHVYSFDFQMLAGAGYAVLFVNQRGSTGYGEAFASQIIGDWGNLDYTDLMAGVDAAVAAGLADPERLGVCGLSGGGNLSTWIVGQTGRFKAAVPENPVTNWVSFYGVSDIGTWFAPAELGGHPHEIPEVYARCSPITYAHRCTTPTLLIQGEADYRCPAEQSEQFFAVLKVAGCPVEMVRLPASPHAASIFGPPEVRAAQNEALLGWMNRYVLGKAEA
jgi:dipeptidyl aminopeptidase/acylaminoacyl peptidase